MPEDRETTQPPCPAGLTPWQGLAAAALLLFIPVLLFWRDFPFYMIDDWTALLQMAGHPFGRLPAGPRRGPVVSLLPPDLLWPGAAGRRALSTPGSGQLPGHRGQRLPGFPLFPAPFGPRTGSDPERPLCRGRGTPRHRLEQLLPELPLEPGFLFGGAAAHRRLSQEPGPRPAVGHRLLRPAVGAVPQLFPGRPDWPCPFTPSW